MSSVCTLFVQTLAPTLLFERVQTLGPKLLFERCLNGVRTVIGVHAGDNTAQVEKREELKGTVYAV